MAKTTTTRQIMLSDITNLTFMLNKAEYNCKATLNHKGKPFRGDENFKAPKATYEQTRRYTINNLIDLKELLNQLDLGEKQEAPKETDEPV